ncbi:MAG: hypothetical protein AAF696_06495 [Bacteroidota bacterium]
MKNIYFLIFLLLFLSCSKVEEEQSDWSQVEQKFRMKDSVEADKLSRKAEKAIKKWAAYPDVKLDSLQKDTQPEL